jgi:hypothetical protein
MFVMESFVTDDNGTVIFPRSIADHGQKPKKLPLSFRTIRRNVLLKNAQQKQRFLQKDFFHC